MEELSSLVARAQNGDLDSFNTIVTRFQDMAVTYAFSQLGDFHLAQDAAQEAFVGAYLNLQQLKEPAAFSAWFRRLILTHCDRFRRRKRISTRRLDDAVASDTEAPDVLLDQRNRKEAVFGAIEALPEQERIVVLLFYISEHKQDKIASFLEIPISTVNNRLYAARKRLKKEFRNMANNDLRPSRGQEFSGQVQNSLKALEELHRKLATLMASLISDGLPTSAHVEVVSASQETYVDFLESLPNPSCTLTMRITPSKGRVTFNIPMSLAWALLDHLNLPESANRWEKEERIEWEEIAPLCPFFTDACRKLELTWGGLVELRAEDAQVDTNPPLLLAQPEFRSAEALETVVHLRLDLKSAGLSDQISLCYPPVVLRSLLPILNQK